MRKMLPLMTILLSLIGLFQQPYQKSLQQSTSLNTITTNTAAKDPEAKCNNNRQLTGLNYNADFNMDITERYMDQ